MEECNFSEAIETGEYQRLREAVGWPELPNEEAESGLEHSSFICACRISGEIAGAVRLIWDHGYIAYFSDLMVMPEHQGKGIGKRLAEKAIEWLKKKKPQGWKIKIVLISTPGNEGFYERLGFERRPSGNMGSGMDKWLI